MIAERIGLDLFNVLHHDWNSSFQTSTHALQSDITQKLHIVCYGIKYNQFREKTAFLLKKYQI